MVRGTAGWESKDYAVLLKTWSSKKIHKKQQKITDFLKKWLDKFVEYFYGDLCIVCTVLHENIEIL
jgi:hypothetical protein